MIQVEGLGIYHKGNGSCSNCCAEWVEGDLREEGEHLGDSCPKRHGGNTDTEMEQVQKDPVERF